MLSLQDRDNIGAVRVLVLRAGKGEVLEMNGGDDGGKFTVCCVVKGDDDENEKVEDKEEENDVKDGKKGEKEAQEEDEGERQGKDEDEVENGGGGRVHDDESFHKGAEKKDDRKGLRELFNAVKAEFETMERRTLEQWQEGLMLPNDDDLDDKRKEAGGGMQHPGQPNRMSWGVECFVSFCS